MGSEGQQDIEMAILTALLKGIQQVPLGRLGLLHSIFRIYTVIYYKHSVLLSVLCLRHECLSSRSAEFGSGLEQSGHCTQSHICLWT